jgi:anaerobic selenocysteine-containing dehydrogenase
VAFIREHPEFPLRLVFAAHPAGWSTGALCLREELLRREFPESTLTASPKDLKASGLKPGWPAKVATPAGEAVLVAREDVSIPPGVMLVVSAPASPASSLRGLKPNEDRTALGTQPVPARLEKA